jgi:hypothetical protein
MPKKSKMKEKEWKYLAGLLLSGFSRLRRRPPADKSIPFMMTLWKLGQRKKMQNFLSGKQNGWASKQVLSRMLYKFH